MDDLTHRLRCKYPLGPIQANGEPEFGWRDFSGPAVEGMVLPTAIMLEAANRIDQQQRTLTNIETFVACDASAISYLSLGEYRTALLKMLREGANP
ncbi:hypothetical protein [Alcaligenes faecalis]|uniref:hypothetical protein n=1 Tax=Alcaligenes faecalis TaxID=511 RepID=UPI0005A79400|nr:hypothetical protein [Alcaligenes faecalis]ATI00016.1 hypothetical protein CPY64_09865 [Alcaligenes faecalis]AYZ92802.1 hypothetical protein EGY22_15635 [Alcaligenes faecalis]MCX5593572.1 hypothetical protein [Alcaligenes faecalis]QQC31392.1 hypothetical protein I6H81_12065 [Alcaligenes faecalis]CAJ0905739.1 transposase [Alcaligenes faecalis subsp. faecalis]